MADCFKCDGCCCKYISLTLGTPKETDLETLKWILAHKNTFAYVETNSHILMLEFKTPCKYQDPETNLCKIYERRSQICKSYKEKGCEVNPWALDKHFKRQFSTPEDVEKYEKEFAKELGDIKLKLAQNNIETIKEQADCFSCNSQCCTHITSNGSNKKIESIKWFLCHENTCVYIDDNNKIFLEIAAPCNFLDKTTNKCIRSSKFPICLAEREKRSYKQKIDNIDDWEEYVRETNLKDE